jgi:hypothetical protein
MADRHVERPHFHESDEAGVTQYQAVSPLAVIAVVLGLLSFLAFVSPVLWILPIAAFAVSIVALVRIARFTPALIGRKAALVGLALAVVAGMGGATAWYVDRWMVCQEAQQVGMLWMDYMVKNQPHRAFEMTIPPAARQPVDDPDLFSHFAPGTQARTRLERFISKPAHRALMALGRSDPIVRFFDTDECGVEDKHEVIYQTFAVTYQDGGTPKTCFYRIQLNRSRETEKGRAFWTVGPTVGGVRPAAFKNDG